MPRIRDLGIYESTLPPGPHNAITDVPGVAVGHFTLISGDPNPDDPTWQPGGGPFRTGVTVIVPHPGNLYDDKVSAAVHTINGFGKVLGFEQVRELGVIETPIALTGTMNVFRVADALMTLTLETNPHAGLGFPETGWRGYASVNPVVGETSDGYLSDMQARPIGLVEVRAALADARSGPMTEGSVGAGTGTSCYGWKGGIGTASRVLPDQAGSYTIGALVQSNFGRAEELTVCGVPVGHHLQPPPDAPAPPDVPPAEERGSSIMMILATDAPLDARQLGRLCQRAAFGLARTGSNCHGGSGDFVIAFSTTKRVPDRPESLLTTGPIFHEQPVMSALALAVIESIEEAIYNSLLMAETVVGRQGHTRHRLPADKVTAIVSTNARRITSAQYRDV